MSTSLRTSVLAVVAALSFAACGNPAPTCSATETQYTVCSDEQVWECQRGTDEQLAKKEAITDACGNDTACLLSAKYEMYPMTLKAKCGEGGLRCVESVDSGGKSAS